jgi:hypothetical protein
MVTSIRNQPMPRTTPETERWLTPRWVLDALGDFDLDPCAAPDWATAETMFTPETHGDGLSLPWSGRVWLNPPYGHTMGTWIRRLAEHGRGTALVFARTDTTTFHEYVWPYAAALLFIRGRLTFNRPDGSEADFNSGAASVLIAYGQDDADQLEHSGIVGAFVPLRATAIAQ